MNNAISGIRILPVDVGTTPTRPTVTPEKFADTLENAMQQVESSQAEAQNKVTELLNGQGLDVHSAMIAVEKADLSFQLMMQVRNKIVAAYQEISRMQF
jgi:flagellar hook-basal body complex protein FliE